MFVSFLIYFIPWVFLLIDGPITVTRWDRAKGKIEANVGPSEQGWISTQKISKNVLHAIVVAEDSRFYKHWGLDFTEIFNSLKTNLKQKKYVRGGSTITQQVVKVAFLSREKSMFRKLREMTGALLLERIMSKDKILEWYINLAEFGDGVYGIREGCWHYFNTKPEILTIEQAIHLALVLPSPNKWSIGLRRKSLTDFGHRRFAYLVNRMRRNGYITETQWFHAMSMGDFGRPIKGYADVLAAQKQYDKVCASENCGEAELGEIWDEDYDTLVFPEQPQPTSPPDRKTP